MLMFVINLVEIEFWF